MKRKDNKRREFRPQSYSSSHRPLYRHDSAPAVRNTPTRASRPSDNIFAKLALPLGIMSTNDGAGRAPEHKSFIQIPELVEMIAKQLDKRSLRNFRRTSHWNYHCSHRTFLERHFSTMVVDFSSPSSLRRLRLCAQDAATRLAVRELIFELKPQTFPADLKTWPLTDNESLDLSSDAAKTVRDSIAAFRGCRTLKILDTVALHLGDAQHRNALFDLGGAQYRPVLSVTDAAHLVLSVFSRPGCPRIDTVVISDATYWPHPANARDADRTGRKSVV